MKSLLTLEPLPSPFLLKLFSPPSQPNSTDSFLLPPTLFLILSPVSYLVGQWLSTLVLRDVPALHVSPAPIHLIQWNGRYQASAELDNNSII